MNYTSYDECIDAIKRDSYNLKYVEDKFLTDEIPPSVCKLAVQQTSHALKYVKDKFLTDEIYKLAVQQNGILLQFVKNQTFQLCDFALSLSQDNYEYIEDKVRYDNYLKFNLFQIINHHNKMIPNKEILRLIGKYVIN
jgi:hypothetical protein